MATIVDSYSETNRDDAASLSNYSAHSQLVGQSFTGDGGVLNSVKFHLKKFGTPTGNIYAKIYAHTGTFGTSSIPTGAVLATSVAVDVSTISAVDYELITFTFSGADKITLTSGTKYCVEVDGTGYGTETNLVGVGVDASYSSHDGNANNYASSTWTAYSAFDTIFYVYKDDATTALKDILQPGIIPFPR